MPDGSTIVFRAGTTYRLDHGIKLVNRHHLTFEGNGATLKANGSGSGRTPTRRSRCGALDTYITIQRLHDRRQQPDRAVQHRLTAPREPDGRDRLRRQARRDRQQHDPQHLGRRRLRHQARRRRRNTVRLVRGHQHPRQHVLRRSAAWAWRSSPPGASRSSATASTQMSLDVLDIEPDWAAPRTAPSDVLFKDNTIGTYAHTRPVPQPRAVDLRAQRQRRLRNVTVDNNVVTGGRQVNAQKLRGRRDRSSRPDRTAPTSASRTTARPPPARATCWTSRTSSTLTVTGNVQPLTSGQFAYLHQQHERHVPLGQIGRYGHPDVRSASEQTETVMSARLQKCAIQPSKLRTSVLHLDRVSTDGEPHAEAPDSGQADGTPTPGSLPA